MDPSSVEVEDVAGSIIVEGIEVNPDLVISIDLFPRTDPRPDRVVGVGDFGPYVEKAFILQKPDLSDARRRASFGRLESHELGDGRCGLPDGLVQSTVYRDRLRGTDNRDFSRLGPRCPEQEATKRGSTGGEWATGLQHT